MPISPEQPRTTERPKEGANGSSDLALNRKTILLQKIIDTGKAIAKSQEGTDALKPEDWQKVFEKIQQSELQLCKELGITNGSDLQSFTQEVAKKAARGMEAISTKTMVTVEDFGRITRLKDQNGKEFFLKIAPTKEANEAVEIFEKFSKENTILQIPKAEIVTPKSKTVDLPPEIQERISNLPKGQSALLTQAVPNQVALSHLGKINDRIPFDPKTLQALRNQPITAQEWSDFISNIRQLNTDGIRHLDLLSNTFVERDAAGKLQLHVIDWGGFSSSSEQFSDPYEDVQHLKDFEYALKATGALDQKASASETLKPATTAGPGRLQESRKPVVAKIKPQDTASPEKTTVQKTTPINPADSAVYDLKSGSTVYQPDESTVFSENPAYSQFEPHLSPQSAKERIPKALTYDEKMSAEKKLVYEALSKIKNGSVALANPGGPRHDWQHDIPMLEVAQSMDKVAKAYPDGSWMDRPLVANEPNTTIRTLQKEITQSFIKQKQLMVTNEEAAIKAKQPNPTTRAEKALLSARLGAANIIWFARDGANAPIGSQGDPLSQTSFDQRYASGYNSHNSPANADDSRVNLGELDYSKPKKFDTGAGRGKAVAESHVFQPSEVVAAPSGPDAPTDIATSVKPATDAPAKKTIPVAEVQNSKKSVSANPTQIIEGTNNNSLRSKANSAANNTLAAASLGPSAEKAVEAFSKEEYVAGMTGALQTVLNAEQLREAGTMFAKFKLGVPAARIGTANRALKRLPLLGAVGTVLEEGTGATEDVILDQKGTPTSKRLVRGGLSFLGSIVGLGGSGKAAGEDINDAQYGKEVEHTTGDILRKSEWTMAINWGARQFGVTWIDSHQRIADRSLQLKKGSDVPHFDSTTPEGGKTKITDYKVLNDVRASMNLGEEVPPKEMLAKIQEAQKIDIEHLPPDLTFAQEKQLVSYMVTLKVAENQLQSYIQNSDTHFQQLEPAKAKIDGYRNKEIRAAEEAYLQQNPNVKGDIGLGNYYATALEEFCLRGCFAGRSFGGVSLSGFNAAEQADLQELRASKGSIGTIPKTTEAWKRIAEVIAHKINDDTYQKYLKERRADERNTLLADTPKTDAKTVPTYASFNEYLKKDPELALRKAGATDDEMREKGIMPFKDRADNRQVAARSVEKGTLTAVADTDNPDHLTLQYNEQDFEQARIYLMRMGIVPESTLIKERRLTLSVQKMRSEFPELTLAERSK